MGEPSGFESFMVEFRTRELQISKRYRFQATPGYADELRELCDVGSPGGTACIPATPDFDDPAQFKYTISSLIRKFNTTCTVTDVYKRQTLSLLRNEWPGEAFDDRNSIHGRKA